MSSLKQEVKGDNLGTVSNIDIWTYNSRKRQTRYSKDLYHSRSNTFQSYFLLLLTKGKFGSLLLFFIHRSKDLNNLGFTEVHMGICGVDIITATYN